MAFSISKKDFMDLVQKTFPVVPSRTSLQVLNNFKISILNGEISIVASDLDNFVRATCAIEGEGDVEIAVNARKLFEILKEIGDEQIELKIIDNSLHIVSETGFSCFIMGVDIREFPHFPESDYSERLTILRDDFNSLVSKSSFAVSKDESRACLCGVLWEVSPERTGMVATDGHRLGATFNYTSLGADKDFSLIIPPKSLSHLQKVLEFDAIESLSFSIYDKHIIFFVDGFTLSTKLIDGPYPDYEKGIPKEFVKSSVVDKANLYNAIKRVSVLSNKKTQLVKCIFKGNELSVSATNRDIGGEAKQLIPVEYNYDDEQIIGFNGAYLLEILSVIKTDKVRIEMNSPVSATVLLPVNDDEKERKNDDVFLIMPLRIFE